MKNHNLRNVLITLLLNAALLATGCGGGGGGTPAPAQSTATISSSTTAKNFIARQIASTYSSLDSYAGAGKRKSLRAVSELKTATITEPGTGQVRVTYDTTETVNLWGVNYTYYAGYQDLIARDNDGNPTDNENIVDSIEISCVNMGCRINDGINSMDLVYNGKLFFSGLYNAITLTVNAQNLNMAGTINNTDQISWTINGNVSVNQSSYPYPVNGSSESGTMVFNGHTYNYSTSYNGSNRASVNFSGAETFSLTINLATGAVVDSSSSGQPSIIGSWKLVEEERIGVMAPVKPNDSGNVSVTHFYEDNTFKIETIERFTTASIDYWQSFNIPAKITHGTWQLDGNQLTLKSGEQVTLHNVNFNNNFFTQVNQYDEKFTWQKL
ncbi:MAG: hypothetical protein GX569_15145 [Candidatus Riflebacteria bacterium]|nr:hypothetical protein [Candidatus Riflebacteria bacterium]